MVFETKWDEANERVDTTLRSGFQTPITPTQTVHVMEIILNAIQSTVGQRLFEGLSQISIDEKGLTLTFRFSINKAHIERVEAQIQRKELVYHRGNFMMFVFARVDEVYPLDDTLPSGFQQNLDMPLYIK